VAALVGQLAEDLCAPLLQPSPENQAGGDMLKMIDIELYAEDGQLAECPALRGLTTATVADVIGKLLEPRWGSRTADRADHWSPAWPAGGPLPHGSRRGPRTGGADVSVTEPTDPLSDAALTARAMARDPNSAAKAQGNAPGADLRQGVKGDDYLTSHHSTFGLLRMRRICKSSTAYLRRPWKTALCLPIDQISAAIAKPPVILTAIGLIASASSGWTAGAVMVPTPLEATASLYS
jgi:hypothetical protein